MPHALNLHCLRWGADGPNVILLHGLTGCAAIWSAVGSALATAGYRVIAPDLRGHGGSPKPGQYGMDAYAQDVIHLIETTGGAPVHLVGHSMGATIGWLVAGARPDLVRTLVLEDQSPAAAPERARGWQDWATAWPRHFESHEEGLDFLREAGRSMGWWAPSLSPLPAGGWGWAFDHEAIVASAQAIVAHDRWDELARVVASTLVIRGEESLALKGPDAERMAATLQHGELLTIPGADHWVHRDAKPYVQALRHFFATKGSY